MLGLPQITEVKRPLPKAQIYRQYKLKTAQRESFDADVARMEIVNAVIPQTVPAIQEGQYVKGIFVVYVELKKLDFNEKSIQLIAQLIPQKIVFALHWENRIRLAVFNNQLFLSDWYNTIDEIPTLLETKSNLDALWESIVATVGGLNIKEDGLSVAIETANKRNKLKHDIEVLQKRLNNCRQNHKQLELFHEIKRLKRELSLIEK